MAVQGLIVPRLSRLAGDAGRLPVQEARGAAWTLRRQTRLLALAFTGLALVMIAVAVPVAHLVLAHVAKFADIAPLALPLSMQAGIYLVELPFAAALRGMHRARLLFLRYCIFTAASLTGLVIGAGTDRLQGAVWGLVAGAAVSLATMISFYRYAVVRLGGSDSDPPAPGAQPVPAVAEG
jgi:O-antigen/teichoic acid export membrane protein